MYILQGLILTYTNFTSTETEQWSKVKNDMFTMIEVFFQVLKVIYNKFKLTFNDLRSLIYTVNIFTHSYELI
jgi:hypothetical protein